MIRAFYTTARGLVAQSTRQDIIANNIANAQSPGFKRQSLVSSSFKAVLAHEDATLADKQRPPYPGSPVNPVMVQVQSTVDTSEGPIRTTGNRMEFAIDGPGAFEVISKAGARQTRNGSFRIDAAGELCTADGGKVQGESGAIRVPDGEWKVESDGSIVVDGFAGDKIKIVGSEEGRTHVIQGAVEGSNVNIVNEMVEMIANLRSFEANQRVITSIDQTLDKLINQAGRV